MKVQRTLEVDRSSSGSRGWERSGQVSATNALTSLGVSYNPQKTVDLLIQSDHTWNETYIENG